MCIRDRLLLVFIVFSSRIFLPFSWSEHFVPVVSPLYRQQESWLWSGVRQAVYAHVGSGMVCFLCIILQFDKSFRSTRPDLHRLCGRVYVVAGLVCVLSLRQLRGTTGAGSDPGHSADLAMVLFIDTASLLWFGATAAAMYFVVLKKDYSAHKRWMTVSMGVMFVPVVQRLVSYFLLVPLFTFLRGLVVVSRFGQPPWEARWGAPGSVWTLMWSMPATDKARLTGDPRASPYIWNFEGYGEAEQASFWLTAWVGLAVVVACLLYTSDAADEEDSVDLGGRRIVKKKQRRRTKSREVA
eukprot:TRINITY_DN46108_c0_g1_i1.p1 TRINITY_DN46108_c0_g1~~TRINITY_DN46108_c0_g1_i1.p1  ORF type:complete len:297 (-),score=47.31 TRINITY_DN46108_c0_g1_i1:29-919(-)